MASSAILASIRTPSAAQSAMNLLSRMAVGGVSVVNFVHFAMRPALAPPTDVHLPKIVGATRATTCHALWLPASRPM